MRIDEKVQVSILLATKNRCESLSKLLSRLQLIEHPPSWELIIGDNASFDDTKSTISKFKQLLPIRCFYAPISGKSRTLNQGVHLATGEICVFIDDDIVPHNSWLTSIRNYATNYPHINVFGGRILVNEVLPKWLHNSYNLQAILATVHDLGDDARVYKPGEYPIGPNITVRTQLLKNFEKPWPETIGPGTELPVGDEYGFLSKVSPPAARDRMYIPEALVTHKPRLEEFQLLNAIQRCYQGGYAAAIQTTYQPVKTNDVNVILTIKNRLASCRSLQEFILSCSRSLGFVNGKITSRFLTD